MAIPPVGKTFIACPFTGPGPGQPGNQWLLCVPSRGCRGRGTRNSAHPTPLDTKPPPRTTRDEPVRPLRIGHAPAGVTSIHTSKYHQSWHHSYTFPCMSYSPHGLGSFCPTGCVCYRCYRNTTRSWPAHVTRVVPIAEPCRCPRPTSILPLRLRRQAVSIIRRNPPRIPLPLGQPSSK